MATRYNQSSSTEPTPGQAGSTELATTGAPVSSAAAAPPSSGQVPTATSATTYTWQTPSGGGTFVHVPRPVDSLADTTTDTQVQTTDATVTTVATYDTQADEEAISIQAVVWGRESATDDMVKYVIEALFNRDDGAPGTVTSKDENVVSIYEDQAAWDVTFNIVDQQIQVQVTGEAAKTIEWRCQLEASELAGAAGVTSLADTTDDQTVQTTDATVTTIATYSTLSDEKAISIKAHVWSRQATTDDSAKYVIEALFNRDGSSVVTSKDENFLSVYEDQAAWDVTFNISGSDIQIQVTGEAAKTIEWRIQLEVSEHG